MNASTSNSKSNETVPTATDPSTAVTLEEAKEIARAQHEAFFVKRMGETEGKKEAARVWETMWAEEDEECCDGCHKHLVENRTFHTEDGVFCKACLEARPAKEEEEEEEDETESKEE